MKTVIEMAREAGWDEHHAKLDLRLERFAALVREDEQEKQQRKAALDEMSAIGQELRLDELPDVWQPIETAPRYGRILVTGTEIGTCVASAGWGADTPDDIRWEVVNDIVVTPTHWMPIPHWNYGEREKQQDPIGYFIADADGFLIQSETKRGIPLYTTPPTAALAARQMRDAAVNACDDLYKHDRKSSGYDEGWNDGLDIAEQAIAALPVPSCASNASLEVQWRDLTDDEIDTIEQRVYSKTLQKDRPMGIYVLQLVHAVIAKFKEKQL